MNENKNLIRQVTKTFNRVSRNMRENNQSIDALILFLDNYPELFADNYDEIGRDMEKWVLSESIKKNRKLIDKIQEIERTLNLAMHDEW